MMSRTNEVSEVHALTHCLRTNFVLVGVFYRRRTAMWWRAYKWASKYRSGDFISNSKHPTQPQRHLVWPSKLRSRTQLDDLWADRSQINEEYLTNKLAP